MSDLEQYLRAATRANTRRSYRSALKHFEQQWGGMLPASSEAVARYLVDYAGKLSINTLRQRLAALALWHQDQGFADPTKSPLVRKTFRGIGELHSQREKQAKALSMTVLEQLDACWQQQLAQQDDTRLRLSLLRNRALILTGFWRGFRSDELCRLQTEQIQPAEEGGLLLYLPRTKTHSALDGGQEYYLPKLAALCPVAALEDWLHMAGFSEGPLFRKISRWGEISPTGINSGSITPLLRRILTQAGIPEPERYSSHSLRRGFAQWAGSQGWDMQQLMDYVGWKDVNSALRYLRNHNQRWQQRLDTALPHRNTEKLPG